MSKPEVTGRKLLRLSEAQKRSPWAKTKFYEWVEEGHVRFFKLGTGRTVCCWLDEYEAAFEKMAAEGAPCAAQARNKTAPPQKTPTRYQRNTGAA